jgi:UTP--glucose-1-phosphate uridylyltransferase
MTKVTKAVIPCGGMGTRFLPVTKALPKELLPVVDTPVLAYIVDEAVKSGITDILIVLGRGKEMIRNYFTPSSELEEKLLAQGKEDQVKILKRINEGVEISFAYQLEPKGNADAIYQAKSFTGDEAFALAWGDDLIINDTPVMSQLATAYEKYGKMILGVQRYDGDDIVKYGVAKISESFGRAHKCVSIVEKPSLSEIPNLSRLTSLGRYVLDARIYKEIENLKPGRGGELQISDALNSLCHTDGVYAYEFEGKRYDMGDKLGSAIATVELGLNHPEIADGFKAYLKEFVKTL